MNKIFLISLYLLYAIDSNSQVKVISSPNDRVNQMNNDLDRKPAPTVVPSNPNSSTNYSSNNTYSSVAFKPRKLRTDYVFAIGLKYGISFASQAGYTEEEKDYTISESLQPVPLIIGLVVSSKLTNSVYFDYELAYLGKGTVYTFKNSAPNSSDYEETTNLKLNYLQQDWLLKLALGKTNAKFTIFAGPYYALFLNGEAEREYYSQGNRASLTIKAESNTNNGPKAAEGGITSGIGLLQNGKYVSFFSDIRLSRGLSKAMYTDLFKDESKNYFVALNFGVFFTL